MDCPHYFSQVVLVDAGRVGVVADRPDVLGFGKSSGVAGKPTLLFATLSFKRSGLGEVRINHLYA